MMGAAVAVRDAGHIGFESLAELLPPGGRRRLQLFVHALVLLFGALMAWYCGLLAESVHSYKIPNLGLSEGWKYAPATLSRSEEHTSELQSLMRISYAVFCLKK